MFDEDEPWPIATRRQARRIIGSRHLRRALRHAGNRDLPRWWTRAVPLWPPSVAPWAGPYDDRPRRHRRRPVVRSRRCA